MWTIQKATIPYRKDQDRIMCYAVDSGYVVGVFDGHGSKNEMVEHCVSSFPKALNGINSENGREFLVKAFDQIADETKHCLGGSTATVAYLSHTGAVAAGILGDSPILVRRDSGDVIIGPIHNVGSNISERNAAIDRGGRFGSHYIGHPRQNWGLQVGRSFESQYHRPIISVTPEIKECTVSTGGWVAVMSDGVLNSIDDCYDEHQEKLIQAIDQDRTASQIVAAIKKRQDDDASLIICRYRS